MSARHVPLSLSADCFCGCHTCGAAVLTLPQFTCRSLAQHNAARDATSSSNSTAQQGSSGARAAAGQGDAPAFSLSSSAQDKIRTQQRLQGDLTGELLEMGQELKASTLAMQSAIRCVSVCVCKGVEAPAAYAWRVRRLRGWGGAGGKYCVQQ